MWCFSPRRRSYAGSFDMTSKIRFVAFLFAAVFVLTLVSCEKKAPADVFDGFISAVASCDAKNASEFVSSDSYIERFSDALSSSDEFGRKTLGDVYSLIKFTIVSANVERDEAGDDVVISDLDRQTMRIDISLPDLASLMSLTMSEMMFSSKQKCEVMRDFLDDGTVGRYITKMTLDVVMTKENGEWKLPFSQNENKHLYDALGINSFAPWLLG